MKSPITNQPGSPVWKMRAAWLALIPALAILCLAAASKSESSRGDVENNAPHLEGSWSVALTVEGQLLPVEPLVSYSGGGAMVLSDPTVFPVWPMSTPYHGTWAKKRSDNFVFAAIGYRYDETVEPPVLWKIVAKEHVTMEPGGDAYHGEGTVAWYYPNGEFGGSVAITTHGTRIKAE